MLRETEEPALSEGESETQRLEAFSDGVFAIAITLLILEVKIPHGAGSGRSLARDLFALWPSYLSYILTFVMVGIYWVNHHSIFRLYRATNHVFNLLNVLFLMCISFLPLPAAALGEYVLRPESRCAAIAFYTFGLLLCALAWMLMWLYASRNYRLIEHDLAPAFVRHMTLQYLVSPAVYLVSLAVTPFRPLLGLAIASGLTLLYLMPPRKPVYRLPQRDETDAP